MENAVWRNRNTNKVVFQYMVDDTASIHDEVFKMKADAAWDAEFEVVVINFDVSTLNHRWGDAFVWNEGEGQIAIDVPLAKEVRKDELRQQRVSLLRQLDVDFMRALEQGDSVLAQTIGIEKQRLRDITSLVDPCATLAEIDAVSI